MASGDAQPGEIIDAMAAIAMQELASQGLRQAFGRDIPESYNGDGLTMLFWAQPQGGEIDLRAQGKASVGQFDYYHYLQGCLIIGARGEGMPQLLATAYPWVHKVFDAFWLHQTLGDKVKHLLPQRYKYDTLPWGDAALFCILFDWEARTTVRPPKGQ